MITFLLPLLKQCERHSLQAALDALNGEELGFTFATLKSCKARAKGAGDEVPQEAKSPEAINPFRLSQAKDSKSGGNGGPVTPTPPDPLPTPQAPIIAEVPHVAASVMPNSRFEISPISTNRPKETRLLFTSGAKGGPGKSAAIGALLDPLRRHGNAAGLCYEHSRGVISNERTPRMFKGE